MKPTAILLPGNRRSLHRAGDRRLPPRLLQRNGRAISAPPCGSARDVSPEGARRPEGPCGSRRHRLRHEEGEAHGYWVGPTAPLVPGFHYYSLNVDGVAMNDPGSETFYGYIASRVPSRFPKPASTSIFRRTSPMANCESARITRRFTETWRRAMVYTPPGYDSGRPVTRCCICSTAPARTNAAGGIRGMSRSSWTTC